MPKQPPTVEGERHCPLINRGCIRDACMFWIPIWGKKNDDEMPVLDEECAVVWNVLLQRETLVETARVTAGHDKAANQVNMLGHIINEKRISS